MDPDITIRASEPSHGAHAVMVHEDGDDYARTIVGFLGPIMDHKPVIVVATAPHIKAVEARLEELGSDPDDLRGRGLLQTIDANEAVDAMLKNGDFDFDTFNNLVLSALSKTNVNLGTPRVYGELVDVLASTGDHDLAVLVEHLWSGYGKTTELHLLCGYSRSNLDFEPHWADIVGQLHQSVLDPMGIIPRAHANN